MDLDDSIEQLLVRETSGDAEEALQHLALLVDASYDQKSTEGLRRALNVGETIPEYGLTDNQKWLLHYYISNAWGDLYELETPKERTQWEWEQPCIENQIHHLRQALALLPERPPAEYACPFHTNFGNSLNSIGRFVEAIGHWQRALDFEPSFGMAHGNLGVGLYWYAYYLYDQGHARVLLKAACEHLRNAEAADIHPGAKEGFESKREEIESMFGGDTEGVDVDLHGFEIGSTPQEIRYREWCLEERLFLNPLNDLGPYRIAARDILTQPSIVTGIAEGPYYPGFFNQMKQEFVSARFLFFEGTHAAGPHYSDAGVALYNTADYPCYGLGTEKVRISFRMAYSLLDKTAYFLNHYLELGIDPTRVNFRTLWYENLDKNSGLRPFFKDRENLPLRGLFWLSKDIFEKREGFRDSIEPDAQKLDGLRHHLEHKYLKLHDDLWSNAGSCSRDLPPGLIDTLAHSLHLCDFEKKTLKVLKLARAALIYLSLGIHAEEKHRAAERGGASIVPAMGLEILDDEWKR